MNKVYALRFITYSFFLFTFSVNLYAQDINFARQVIDTLTSPAMHGRGYVNNGVNLTADYLKHRFDSLQLQPFKKDYFQEFSFPVNTFPGEIALSLDGKELIPGKDFILAGVSGSGHGSYDIFPVRRHYKPVQEEIEKFLASPLINKVIVFDYDSLTTDDHAFLQIFIKEELPKQNRPAAILFIENKKLTMDVSSAAFSYPVFTVLRSALPKDAATGAAILSKSSFNVKSKRINNFNSQNVAGYIKGTQYPDSFIVYTAHYDHLGRLGKAVYFPGANDNASGISMLLNLAGYYAKKENRPKYSIAFIAFAGEEIGLLGSKYFTEHPLIPLSAIKFLLNMDLLGTGEGGMMVVNATEFPQSFSMLDSINNAKKYLVKLGQRGKARNSDHYWFTEKGVPSFFIYTLGGISAYHDIYDIAETLPLTEFEDVFRLIVDFTSVLQK